MEKIFILTTSTILFFYFLRIIFEYYIQHSKKYKDLNIIGKVSKFANNNKAIVILGYIVVIVPPLYFLECFVLITFAIVLLKKTGTFINENLIELIADVNFIAYIIWLCSILIRTIYYIIVYIKEMKLTKRNES